MPSLPTLSTPRRPTDVTAARPLRGAHCRCDVCELEFNSISAFDCHRAGEWIARRCLTRHEMLSRGMALNRDGWWVSRIPIPRGHAILGAAIVSGALQPQGGGGAWQVCAPRELAEDLAS